MAITIRKSVFETNSSSTHSIVIEEGNKWSTITPNEEGIIYLTGGEFGWSWERFNDPLTKANYCAVSCEIGSSKFTKSELEEVIKEYTGATCVEFDISTNWTEDYSYIDHQSIDVIEEISTLEELKIFIFNDSSELITGNDNSSPSPNFYDPKGTIYKYAIHCRGKSLKFNELSKERISKFINEYCIHYNEEFVDVNLNDKTFTYSTVRWFNVFEQIEKENPGKNKLELRTLTNIKFKEVINDPTTQKTESFIIQQFINE